MENTAVDNITTVKAEGRNRRCVAKSSKCRCWSSKKPKRSFRDRIFFLSRVTATLTNTLRSATLKSRIVLNIDAKIAGQASSVTRNALINFILFCLQGTRVSTSRDDNPESRTNIAPFHGIEVNPHKATDNRPRRSSLCARIDFPLFFRRNSCHWTRVNHFSHCN